VEITSLNSHFPPGNSPQDIEKKKAEPKTPHFLSLKQDMVACSQEGKCELKYVMFSLMRSVGTPAVSDIENGRPIAVGSFFGCLNSGGIRQV